jgi:hypothetical protein
VLLSEVAACSSIVLFGLVTCRLNPEFNAELDFIIIETVLAFLSKLVSVSLAVDISSVRNHRRIHGLLSNICRSLRQIGVSVLLCVNQLTMGCC